MERLMSAGLKGRLPALAAHARWELSRGARGFTRRFGSFGWALLGCAACAALALAVERSQAAQVRTLETRLAARMADNAAAARTPIAANPQPASGDAGARARLKAFDEQLLPHGDIPVVVQDLLDLGEAEGLSMQRGSYRPQPDVSGGFLRYRMTLPVKGPGTAIQRFMKAALRKQKNLALDSVQFKRARIGSSDVEARIEWVMLSRLPPGGAVVAVNGASGAAR
jgi:hypothetical protein